MNKHTKNGGGPDELRVAAAQPTSGWPVATLLITVGRDDQRFVIRGLGEPISGFFHLSVSSGDMLTQVDSSGRKFSREDLAAIDAAILRLRQESLHAEDE